MAPNHSKPTKPTKRPRPPKSVSRYVDDQAGHSSDSSTDCDDSDGGDSHSSFLDDAPQSSQEVEAEAHFRRELDNARERGDGMLHSALEDQMDRELRRLRGGRPPAWSSPSSRGGSYFTQLLDDMRSPPGSQTQVVGTLSVRSAAEPESPLLIPRRAPRTKQLSRKRRIQSDSESDDGQVLVPPVDESDDESVATGSVITQASPDPFSEMAPLPDGVSSTVDFSARSGTFAVTYWCPDEPATERAPEGHWLPVAAHVAKYCPNGETVFPAQLARVMRHPDMRICCVGGQYEYCPGTGKLHFQCFFQHFGRPTKKNPGSVETKPALKTFIANMRRCVIDDAVMRERDGLTLADEEFKFNAMMAQFPPRLRVYCSRVLNPDGTVKRAFGDFLEWSINASMTDEVRNGSTLGQMAACLQGGMAPLDVLDRFPSQGLQFWRNAQHIHAEVKARQQDTGTLRRCLNPYCGLPMCDEPTARTRAGQLGISYNEYVENSTKPCDVGVMYSYGDAGTGKSSFSLALAQQENPTDGVYVKSADAFWGANTGSKYEGERALVIHDVSVTHFASGGGRYFDNFKNVVDCTHLSVPVKGGTVPCRVNKFYFDGNVDPCSFFLDMMGDTVTEDRLKTEYPAFRRRIKAVFCYRMSADGLVTTVGQTMPTLDSFLKTFSLRRRWMISKDGVIPSFDYPQDVQPQAGRTHGTLVARAGQALFEQRFAQQLGR